MEETTTRRLDQSALRTNQAFIIVLLLAAFLLDVWWLVAFVSAVMLVGTLFPPAGLFKRIYQHALRPVGLVKPDVMPDNPELSPSVLKAAKTLEKPCRF